MLILCQNLPGALDAHFPAWYHQYQVVSTRRPRVLKFEKTMNELTERQKLILSMAIHEYVRTAAPVSSLHLVEHYHLDMSSATVRNELSALTEMGYLRQPHTSAGRVPTEEGYRYFVGRLVQETNLPDTTRRTISHQFYQMRNDVDQWMVYHQARNITSHTYDEARAEEVFAIAREFAADAQKLLYQLEAHND